VTCLNHTNTCGEANLDVQYIKSVAQLVPTLYYYDNSSDFLLTWSMNLLEMDNPPKVNSISYGTQENTLDADYVDQFETSAILMSALGMTIVASSGDDGAPSSDAFNGICSYSPDWPATSPHVLAVGATQGYS
jgi:tripeptidyl-peptidase-1